MHALTAALAEGQAVFAVDMNKAFNRDSISRVVMFAAVTARAPVLLPVVQCAYVWRRHRLSIVGALEGTCTPALQY